MLHVNTLGKLEVRSDAGPLAALVAQPKRLTLLLYLVLARPHRFHRRDALLALFWPDLDARRARRALNQALSFLRRELGDGVITTRGAEEVAVDRTVVACDAIAFEDAAEGRRWDEALGLYKGDLLPGLHVGGTEVDRWLDPERERLRAMAARATRALALTRLLAGDTAAADGLARRALELAPADEEGARSLIEALARAGNRTAALRFYRLLAESLAREFDLEPSAETQELATAVRDGLIEATLPGQIRAEGESGGSRPLSTERQERNGRGSAQIMVGHLAGGEGGVTKSLHGTLEVISAGRVRSLRRFEAEGLGAGGGRGGRVKAAISGAAVVLLAGLVWAFLRPAPRPVVASYELAFPPGQEPLDEVEPTFALSPDGSFIAYVGPADANKGAANRALNGPPSSQLWIKPRDSFKATPLPGTEGARTPSVSPDGTWIAYVADHRLLKAPVVGGASVALADSVAFDPPAWLSDDTIAYTDHSWQLRRVSAKGGMANVLWTPPDSLYAGGPVPLPKSRGLLFALCDWFCKGSDDYWVMDLHTGEARLLVKAAMWAAYVPPGDLVYVRRNGTAYAVPFDLRSLKITGSPIPVLEHVKVDVGVARGPIPDIDLGGDGTLLYRTGVPISGEVEFVWVTRDGVATPVSPGETFDPGAGNWGWSLSPDGTRLAFRRLTDAGDDIWVQDLQEGTRWRVTTYEGVDRAPGWSPDGTHVTFVSKRENRVAVWTKRADGAGDAQMLFDAGRGISHAFWTPDGKWLVLRTAALADEAGKRDILAVRPGVDSVARPILASRFIEAAPAVSPDSRWIACQTDESGAREVVVQPFPDVDGGRWVVSAAADSGTAPLWAHNGHELFYMSWKGDLVSVQVETGRHFRVVSRHVLFHLGPEYPWESIAGMYDIAPDDQRFLLVRRAGDGAQSASRTVKWEHWTELLKAKMRE